MTKIAFLLDDQNDISYNENTGTFDMVSGDDEVAQYLYLLLGTNLGELDWNQDIGLPHQQLILMGQNRNAIHNMISSYLADMLGNQFVSLDITSFDVDNENRLTSLNANITLNTDDGQITISTAVANDSEKGGDY